MRRYFPSTFWVSAAARPDTNMVVSGWTAITRPASMALSPSTDCR